MAEGDEKGGLERAIAVGSVVVGLVTVGLGAIQYNATRQFELKKPFRDKQFEVYGSLCRSASEVMSGGTEAERIAAYRRFQKGAGDLPVVGSADVRSAALAFQVLAIQKRVEGLNIAVPTRGSDAAGSEAASMRGSPEVLQAKHGKDWERMSDVLLDLGAACRRDMQQVWGVQLGEPDVPLSPDSATRKALRDASPASEPSAGDDSSQPEGRSPRQR